MKQKFKRIPSRTGCIFVYIAAFLLTGCAGTMHTRSNPCGTSFGKPVYAAVVEDFRVTLCGCGGGLGWARDFNMLKPFSFPMDLFFDTVFLPADLIAWGMGYDKYSNSKSKDVSQKPRDDAKLVVWSTKDDLTLHKKKQSEKNLKNDDSNLKE